MKKLVLLLSVVSLFSLCLSAKTMIPVNIDKGEMFDDNTEKVEVSLAEENTGGGASLSLMTAYPAEGGWAGFWMPKKSAWAGFKSLKCFVFSAAKEKFTMSFVIKDQNHKGGVSGRGREGWEVRKTWYVVPVEIKPGMNELSVSLEGLKTQEGKDVDLSRIYHWGFYYRFFPELKWESAEAVPATIWISKVRLDSEK